MRRRDIRVARKTKQAQHYTTPDEVLEWHEQRNEWPESVSAWLLQQKEPDTAESYAASQHGEEL